MKEEEEDEAATGGGFIPNRGIGSPSSSSVGAAAARKNLEVVEVDEEELEVEVDGCGLDVCATGDELLGTRIFGIGRELEEEEDGFECERRVDVDLEGALARGLGAALLARAAFSLARASA